MPNIFLCDQRSGTKLLSLLSVDALAASLLGQRFAGGEEPTAGNAAARKRREDGAGSATKGAAPVR